MSEQNFLNERGQDTHFDRIGPKFGIIWRVLGYVIQCGQSTQVYGRSFQSLCAYEPSRVPPKLWIWKVWEYLERLPTTGRQDQRRLFVEEEPVAEV